jgi:hypothetical protein
MMRSVDEYLTLLKNELSGSDIATIRDALADAEEYLRDALENAQANQPGIREADALPAIIEEFGSPEEIGAAYKKIEARVPPTLARAPRAGQNRSILGRFFSVYTDPAAWGSLLYLLLSLVTGILYFTWAVTGVSLSIGLLVLIISLPFIALFLLSVRGIALVEGRIVEALLGVRMPRRPVFVDKNLGWWGRFKLLVTGKHTWLSILYMLLMLPLGTLYFSIFTILLTLSLSLLIGPLAAVFMDLVLHIPMQPTAALIPLHFPVGMINGTRYYLSYGWTPVIVLVGFLIATLTLHLARLIGRSQGKLAKVLLVSE